MASENESGRFKISVPRPPLQLTELWNKFSLQGSKKPFVQIGYNVVINTGCLTLSHPQDCKDRIKAAK